MHKGNFMNKQFTTSGTVARICALLMTKRRTVKHRSFTSFSLPLLSLMWALTAQATFAQSRYEATVLSDHPVAYYRLGEAPGSTVAVDSSGNANNGTYENGAVLGVPGLIVDPANTAVNFATGDVVIPDAADLNFVNVPFTVEAWVNGTFDGPNLRVFDKAIAGSGNGYVMDLSNDSFRLQACTGLDLPAQIANNTTYHLVGVSDGAGTAYLYVNGSLIGSGPFSSCAPYTGSAHIAVANDGTAHFNGIIDEVAVYNYAISPQRVLAHYQTGISYVVLAPRSLTFPPQTVGTTSTVMYVKLTNISNTVLLLCSYLVGYVSCRGPAKRIPALRRRRRTSGNRRAVYRRTARLRMPESGS